MFKFSLKEYLLMVSFSFALSIQYYFIEKHSIKQELLSIYDSHDYDSLMKTLTFAFLLIFTCFFLIFFISVIKEKSPFKFKNVYDSIIFGLIFPTVFILGPNVILLLVSPFITTFLLLPPAIIIVNLIYKAGEWLNRKLS
jgi:hypothetical protein